MELIAGDGGIIELAEIADFIYDLADLVMLLDSCLESLVGNIDTEVFLQLAEDMVLELIMVVLIVVLGVLEGNIHKLAEELVIINNSHILDGVEVLLLDVLLEAAGDGAGLGGQLRIEEVEAAFESTLEEAASVVANTGGHVISCDVR